MTTIANDPRAAESTGPDQSPDEPAESWPSSPAALPPTLTLTPAPAPAPAPVLAPYLGLVTSVLCALGGGWLLLAPYALDYRRGAAELPRPAAIDLETGAAIVAVALVSAILFSAALFSRLRACPTVVTPPDPDSDLNLDADPAVEPSPDLEPDPEPDPTPTTPTTPTDSSSALREMLTPLVAALAADLRSQPQNRADQHRRQEP